LSISRPHGTTVRFNDSTRERNRKSRSAFPLVVKGRTVSPRPAQDLNQVRAADGDDRPRFAVVLDR
jgi:hypothetical protein